MIKRTLGVTLVELILVIVITGIVGAMVAMFIRRPVEGYVDVARRVELTDIADTALRRMTRDLRTALPNSIRVTTAGGIWYLEYLQTSGGGRYRSTPTDLGAGNILDFTTTDASFDVIGPMPTAAAGNSIVVYNLNSDLATANAYVGGNRAAYGASAGSTITLGAATLFPFDSPGKRFHVVQYPVTYRCDPAAGQLTRFWGYAIQAAQPTAFGVGTNSALLATSVGNCSFSYATGGPTGRTGVAVLSLEIAQSGETVRLFQQVHVSNVP